MDILKNIKLVNKMIFGPGSLNKLQAILEAERKDAFMVFLVDDFFARKDLPKKLPVGKNDRLIYVNVDEEPKTKIVDQMRDEILGISGQLPDGVIGLGGGSVLDYAKALAVMLNNPGPSSDYQGLGLAKNPSVYHVGIPTLSGTGAEVSTTAVLTGPVKKLGIKGEFTPFHQIVLDPEIIQGVPKDQWFYTGMDCYIHNIEALEGNFKNTLSDALANQSLVLCREVFNQGSPDDLESNKKLMVASLLGGLSLSYSEVGVCHAFSYGLSYVLGTHHGIANCIAFNQLEEFYGEGVREFKEMVSRHNITIPANITENASEAELDKMVDTTIALEHMWLHAFGEDWPQHMTREKAKALFQKM